MTAENIRRRTFHFAVDNWMLAAQRYRAAAAYLKRAAFYRRRAVIGRMADFQPESAAKGTIVAVVVHVTSPVAALTPQERAERVDRLRSTIDGLMLSAGGYRLRIAVQTAPGRHIVSDLPDYQRDCVELHENQECDPMFLGFEAQRRFAERLDEGDWFLYLEDDIVINDGYFIGKLARFRAISGDPMAVLIPNRFEFFCGTKRYIDLIVDKDVVWNRLTEVRADGVRFAECTNPHAGLYCLSKDQLRAWMRSPQHLNWVDLGHGGPRECAATYCLQECFSLYKPHPSNIGYLEVRHHDMKYSKILKDVESPYALSAVSFNGSKSKCE
jgi:hypothetical protein